MAEKLGLKESVAMGLGGLIGGGIFAVLGVAANISGNAAFISYFFDGIVALASGYSYVKLTEYLEEDGGSFTFLEHFVSNPNIAGIVGWILIVGYIGSTSMYAYAFGSFAAGLIDMHSAFVRPLISVGVILLFVGINMVGVKSSGSSEDLLVYVKVAILLLFGVAGVWAIFSDPSFVLFQGGLFNKGISSMIIGAAVIFVSFQGFQLLTYEYSDIDGGIKTLKKGVYYSIIAATLIYILVAFTTTNLLTAQQVLVHKETALAYAANKIFSSALLNKISFLLISIAALFSTASAINATIFGTARLTYKMATDKELPELFSFRNRKGIPTRSIISIGVLTMAFTAFGSLEQITTFASLAFIMIFASVNAVCLLDSDVTENMLIPLIGLAGTLTAIPLMLLHLYNTNPHMLVSVVGLFIALALLEILYFERKPLEKEAEKIEREVEEDVEYEAEKIEREVEEDSEKLEEDVEEKTEMIEDSAERHEEEVDDELDEEL
ncbi:MAG: amino acid permease [Candidatus Nanohaloarchaea archaeon]